MNPITLLVQVSVDVAVRAGVARAGAGAVTLTDAHLGALTEAERAQLAETLSPPAGPTAFPAAYDLRERANRTQHGPLVLSSPDTSPEAVVAALRAWLAAEAGRHAAALAAERADLTRAVAETLTLEPVAGMSTLPPWERWRDPASDARKAEVGRAVRLGIEGAEEAREHLAALADEVARRNAEAVAEAAARYCALPLDRRVTFTRGRGWMPVEPPGCEGRMLWHYRAHPGVEVAREEAVAEAVRLDAVDEGRKQAILAAQAAAVRAFAATVPDLAPAAAEGYDVRSGVADELAARVADFGDGPLPPEVYRLGGEGWEALAWEEAGTPRAALLDLRKRVEAHVATVTRPEGVTLVVERAARVTTETRSGDTMRRRGVVVDINGCGLPQRVVVFPAE